MNDVNMIPDDVREIIAKILADWESVPWHVLTMEQRFPYYGKAARILNAINDSQPRAPEPDWTQAPEWATHHAFNPDGNGEWMERPEGSTPPFPYKYMWICHGKSAPSGCYLPEGGDWRTTLRKRPEAEQ